MKLDKMTAAEKLERQQKQSQESAKKLYDKIGITPPKGTKAEIEKRAAALGFRSVNAYICDLINRDLNGSPEPEQQPQQAQEEQSGYKIGQLNIDREETTQQQIDRLKKDLKLLEQFRQLEIMQEEKQKKQE